MEGIKLGNLLGNLVQTRLIKLGVTSPSELNPGNTSTLLKKNFQLHF